MKFKVGDVICSSKYDGTYTITYIDTDKYMVDNSTKYLLFSDEDKWESHNERMAKKQFDEELEELLK